LYARGTVTSSNIFKADEIALLTIIQDSGFDLEFSIEQGRRWAEFTAQVRKFFTDKDFLEVRTPTLVRSPGTEPFLDPLMTEASFDGKFRKLFLPTSPEFHLKKLLAAGFTKIFEFKECFRNHEGGGHHQPEFLMLEWYRAYSNLDAIADDCEQLLKTVSIAFNGHEAKLSRFTIAELFKKDFDFELTPKTSKQELLSIARKQNVVVDVDESWDDIYFRIFLEKIEPSLNQNDPVLIKNYPPSQSALARMTADGWTDRFEIYWRGFEIANAFHELNDPQSNLQRFERDADEARQIGKIPVPHDDELILALKKGMPPSGGIALGMDRLFMAVTGADTISETRAFPFR